MRIPGISSKTPAGRAAKKENAAALARFEEFTELRAPRNAVDVARRMTHWRRLCLMIWNTDPKTIIPPQTPN
jgi:hypothetical protein